MNFDVKKYYEFALKVGIPKDLEIIAREKIRIGIND